MIFNLFSFILLATIGSIAGELEDFSSQRQEIIPLLGNGTASEHVSFMASLRLTEIDSPFGFGHICGAVFITRQVLLTAAVCVVKIDRDYRADELQIVAGSRMRYADTGAYRLSIEKIYVHSQYQRFPVMGMDGNVAIIVVSVFNC